MTEQNFNVIYKWANDDVDALIEDQGEPISYQQTVRFLRRGKDIAKKLIEDNAGWIGTPEGGFTFKPYDLSAQDELALCSCLVVISRIQAFFNTIPVGSGNKIARPFIEKTLIQIEEAGLTIKEFLRVGLYYNEADTIAENYQILHDVLNL